MARKRGNIVGGVLATTEYVYNRVRIGAGIQKFCTSCSDAGRRKGREIVCPHRANRCVLLCRCDLELGRLL